jgi:hypothetical protein
MTVPLIPGKTVRSTLETRAEAATLILCTALPTSAPGIASVKAKIAADASVSLTRPS